MPCIDGKTSVPPNGRIAAALHAAISNHPDARWQTLELLAVWMVVATYLYFYTILKDMICIWKILSRSNYIHIAGLGFTFPPSKGLQLVSRHSWSSSQVRALHWYPTLDEPLHSKPESVWIVEVKNWQVNSNKLVVKNFDVAPKFGWENKRNHFKFRDIHAPNNNLPNGL